MMTKATYYVSCFAWAEDMIEEIVCPSPTSLPFDLSFFDILWSKVNTFGIKEDVRDVLLFAGMLEVGLYVMVGNLEFCPGGGQAVLHYAFQPPRVL